METSKEGLVVGAGVVVEDAETVPEEAAPLLVVGAEVIVPEELELEETRPVEEAEDD